MTHLRKTSAWRCNEIVEDTTDKLDAFENGKLYDDGTEEDTCIKML